MQRPLQINESELTTVIVCQKIKDEITRLENDRTDYSIFTYSTEEKINILNRLLQLIISPYSFPESSRDYFFPKDGISLNHLIQKLMMAKDFEDKESGKKFTNGDIFLAPLNTYEDPPSYTFFRDLIKDHGKLKLKSHEKSKKQQPKVEVDQYVIFGDSLTDINLMRNGDFGNWVGLTGNSPRGSFTNGMTWLGHVNFDLYNKAIIQEIKKQIQEKHPEINPNSVDVNDYINQHKKVIYKQIECLLKQDAERNIFLINNREASRSYAMGGATAHNYKGAPSKSLTRYFTRLIVSTLAEQRQRFLADEAATSTENKKKKLIIEWTGANDLITVNEVPSMLEADNLVVARLQHIKELLANGYLNFVLCNLPDLSLTPRYRNAPEANNARLCIEYANRQLEMGVEELRKMYPDANIHVVDINKKFTACIKGVEKGGDDAKPYEKYIKKGYTFSDGLPKTALKQSGVFYYKIEDNILSYSVMDPCGQVRTGDINTSKLISDIKNIKNTNSSVQNEILGITTEIGHTETDIFKPLKSTKAFRQYQDELAKLNPPQTIEDTHLLPGVNLLYFDEVHPSADMQMFMHDTNMDFIDREFQTKTPKIKLNPINVNQLKERKRARDDFDVDYDKKLHTPEPFTPPEMTEEKLISFFLQHYFDQFNEERKGFFGWLRERNLQWKDTSKITLASIFQHALYPTEGSGARTRDILVKLGWLTSSNQKTLNEEVIKDPQSQELLQNALGNVLIKGLRM